MSSYKFRSKIGALGVPLLLVASLLTLGLRPTPPAQGATRGQWSPAGLLCQDDDITINNNGAASPYPSPLVVSGLGTSLTDVNLRLTLNHNRSQDIDILLVAPDGTAMIPMSDAGSGPTVGTVTITLDDEAASPIPGSPLLPGTYQPTNNSGGGNDSFPVPAPSPPYGAQLSDFDGSNPNGTWSLYVVDDSANGSGGTISQWCLDITAASPTPTATATPIPLPPRLYIPMVRACKANEIEPNNGRQQAIDSGNGICFNTPVSGVMADASDNRDIYFFDITTPTTLRVTVGNVPAGADFDVGLYDPANNPIAFSTNRGSASELIIIDTPLAPGQYVVMVYSHIGYGASPYQVGVWIP